MIFDIAYYKKLRSLYLQLKIVQNAKRLYIINYIENNPGICVGDIVEFLDEPQAIVSQKLAQLRKANIVFSKKEKTRNLYSVNKEKISQLIKDCNTLLDKKPTHNTLKDNYSEVSQAYTGLKVILNSTRWNILDLLHKKGPMSQKEILGLFNIKQPFMAQNLKLLQREGCINEEKKGRDKYYNINKEKIMIIKKAIDN